VQVRIVRFRLSNLAYYKQLELSAADANTRIHLVERSYSTTNRAPAAVTPNLVRRYRAIANAGKLIVAAAWNENANVSTADAGSIGPNRNTSRKDLAGDDAFKRNVLVVGYSGRILTPNIVETKEPTANFGPQLSVVAPDDFLTIGRMGNLLVRGGSSFTTPLVAGIAAELMLVDPTLQQAANIVKVADFIEATADDIDAVAPMGDDNLGHGRVNFWKAVLATANGGLSVEGRTAQADGTDSYFKDLLLKNEAATSWYGFEVRTGLQNTVLWFRNTLGNYSKVQDAGQSRPPIAGAADADVLTYVSTQSNRNAAGRILPSLPFSQAELNTAMVSQRFLARASIKRDQILDKTALLALPLGKTPQADPETVLFELPIDDRTDLRRAQGATGANKDLIKALVKEFNNFVFHIDHVPVPQVRARLPDQAFRVGQTLSVPLELKNLGATDIPVGRWIIRGQGNVLAFDDVADFGPLTAGQVKTVQINMTCLAAGTVTLHVTILRAANTAGNSVVAVPVGPGPNDSRDGTMTCIP
jgi:hypothetical protein